MTRLDRVVQIAQVIIAACAVAALAFAIYQNVETSAVLKSAGEAFSSQTFPVVKFSHYIWLKGGSELSCKVPAEGIMAYAQNMSGIPVIISSHSLTLRMGDRPIMQGTPEKTFGEQGSRILAPGESTTDARGGVDFRPYYARLHGTSGAQMNFDIAVSYSSVTTGRCYKYSGKITIYDDCNKPEQRAQAVSKESISEVACDKSGP